MNRRRPTIHIYTGPINSGKTGAVKQRLRELLSKGAALGGVLSEAVIEGDLKTGYQAVDIASGDRILLVSRSRIDSDVRTGAFFFFEEGFRQMSERILKVLDRDVLVLDEIGPLELEGGGYGPVLRELLKRFRGSLYLVIRDYLLEEITKSFGFENLVEEIVDCSVNEPVFFEPWS